MLDIARHVRIFDLNPTDDLVPKRIAVVTVLAEKFGKLKFVNELLQVAQDVASGLSSPIYEMPAKRTAEVEAAIREQSPAFDREGEQLQILVCTMLAVLTLISESSPGSVTWTKNEVIAVGSWLALSAQNERDHSRLENLRVELMSAARGLIAKSSESSRQRAVVPDPGVKLAALSDATKEHDLNR